MSRSPISGPQTPSPPSTAAVAVGADELTWALVQVLIERKIVSADAIASKLGEAIEELRFTGTVKSKKDEDRLGAVLAIQRVIKRLGEMA